MLSIIVSVIFFGSMILQVLLAIKLLKLLNRLPGENIRINRWSSYAAKKDLKRVLNNTKDEKVKEAIIKILQGIKQRNRLFFGTIGLILIIFFINGAFKLGL
jgi:hypothetical protein